jgi:hypothetical protein
MFKLWAAAHKWLRRGDAADRSHADILVTQFMAIAHRMV